MEKLAYRRKKVEKAPWQKKQFKFFERLEKSQKKRVVDIASDLRISFATVNAWKYGIRKPRPMIVELLESKYGVKVGSLR